MNRIYKELAASLRSVHFLNLVGSIPNCTRWLHDGAIGPAPPPIKRWIIDSYLRRYRLGAFVETGTHSGDTLAYVARRKNLSCISVELSPGFYSDAVRRFSRWGNVQLVHGDSAEVLPEVVRKLREPALFWLDGHYSGGVTARGAADTPISAEIKSVLASPIDGHVILVDDARLFDGTHDYPVLGELILAVRAEGRFNVAVSADIIRFTPR